MCSISVQTLTLELVNPLRCMFVWMLLLCPCRGRESFAQAPPCPYTHTHTHPCAPEPKKHPTCRKTHNLTNHTTESIKAGRAPTRAGARSGRPTGSPACTTTRARRSAATTPPRAWRTWSASAAPSPAAASGTLGSANPAPART